MDDIYFDFILEGTLTVTLNDNGKIKERKLTTSLEVVQFFKMMMDSSSGSGLDMITNWSRKAKN